MEKDTSEAVVKRHLGGQKVEIRTGGRGELIIRTKNPWCIPSAIVEALLIAALMTLNYFFRYDPSFILKNDLVAHERVELSCETSRLEYDYGQPYFDYTVNETKSLEGLQLAYDLPEWVFFLCLFLPSISIICMVEMTRLLFPPRRVKELDSCGITIPQTLRRLTRNIGGFFLGGSSTGFFVSIFKLNVVSPRPHFMSVCFGNGSSFISPNSCLSQNLWAPFSDCSNSNQEAIVEALKSFPSYHGSLAVYSGVFICSYIILGAKIRGMYSIPMSIILGLIVMSMIGATHRLSSGHSFPRDILGGAIIGFLMAHLTVHKLLNKFKERKILIRKGKKPIPSEINEQVSEQKNENSVQPERKESQTDEDEHDSDFDSDSSSDEYEKIVAKIDSLTFLPRVTTTDLPMQAVNSTMNGTRFPPFPPQPNSSNNLPARSHSSVGKEELQKNDHDAPRQRKSVPKSNVEQKDGLTNFGYVNDKNEPSGILSTFNPPRGQQSASYF